jgi:hypothetical protein
VCRPGPAPALCGPQAGHRGRRSADPVAFTKAKHDWIAATLAHLGLADEQPRRLYQDNLNQDNPDRLAS